MFKRILASLLCAMVTLGVCACSDESKKDDDSAVSAEEQAAQSASEASADESEDASEDASEDVSTDEPEGIVVPEGIKDVEGYKQYVTVASVDELLRTRGFRDQGANSQYIPLNYDKMKAVWISQYDFEFVYKVGTKQRSEKKFREFVTTAYDNVISLGINTVIVQVRPNGDSFYPSAYYPWSGYVTGAYGSHATYDPLQIMIDVAHEKGLSFHAWINPMRAMNSADLAATEQVYPISSWKAVANAARCSQYLYDYSGLYYLNISYEEVRNSIINGAAEIVRYYNVDGIDMDDYFYWGEEPAFDGVAFTEAKKENPMLDRQKFRYDNLNKLVSGIYSAIKAENQNVMFGIAPAGNIEQMANKYFVDVDTWLSQDGYVDYIMPQLYFGMEHQTCSFPKAYEAWASKITNPNIKIIAGMSLGKAQKANKEQTGDEYAGTGANEWIENKDVFKKCFEYCVQRDDYSGFSIFTYQYMFNPLTGKPMTYTAEEISNCKDYLTTIIKGEVIKY